jgi:hypothetical protein
VTESEWALEAYRYLKYAQHDSWRCTYAQTDGTLIYGCVCDLFDLLDQYEDLHGGRVRL